VGERVCELGLEVGSKSCSLWGRGGGERVCELGLEVGSKGCSLWLVARTLKK
jgi:hypothetical protein